MCNNNLCPVHPGDTLFWDYFPDRPAIVEAICAHGDIVGQEVVFPEGFWSSAHPINKIIKISNNVKPYKE